MNAPIPRLDTTALMREPTAAEVAAARALRRATDVPRRDRIRIVVAAAAAVSFAGAFPALAAEQFGGRLFWHQVDPLVVLLVSLVVASVAAVTLWLLGLRANEQRNARALVVAERAGMALVPAPIRRRLATPIFGRGSEPRIGPSVSGRDGTEFGDASAIVKLGRRTRRSRSSFIRVPVPHPYPRIVLTRRYVLPLADQAALLAGLVPVKRSTPVDDGYRMFVEPGAEHLAARVVTPTLIDLCRTEWGDTHLELSGSALTLAVASPLDLASPAVWERVWSLRMFAAHLPSPD